MSEQFRGPEPRPEDVDAGSTTDPTDPLTDMTDPDEPPAPAEVPVTGHPAVDAVLASLQRLEDAPVDEHVAVFEEAHTRLRQALADAGDDVPEHDDAGPGTGPDAGPHAG